MNWLTMRYKQRLSGGPARSPISGQLHCNRACLAYAPDRVYDFWSDRRPLFVVFDIFHYLGFCFWKVHTTFKNPVYYVACSHGSFWMVQSCKMLVEPIAVVKSVAADPADKLGRQGATGD